MYTHMGNMTTASRIKYLLYDGYQRYKVRALYVELTWYCQMVDQHTTHAKKNSIKHVIYIHFRCESNIYNYLIWFWLVNYSYFPRKVRMLNGYQPWWWYWYVINQHTTHAKKISMKNVMHIHFRCETKLYNYFIWFWLVNFRHFPRKVHMLNGYQPWWWYCHIIDQHTALQTKKNYIKHVIYIHFRCETKLYNYFIWFW